MKIIPGALAYDSVYNLAPRVEPRQPQSSWTDNVQPRRPTLERQRRVHPTDWVWVRKAVQSTRENTI